MLGKRTKYQETDLAQLVLTVGDPSSQESINSKNKSDAIPEYTSGNMNLLKDDNITLPKVNKSILTLCILNLSVNINMMY